MTIDGPEKPNKFSHWNPLQSLETHDEALKAAKSGHGFAHSWGPATSFRLFSFITGVKTPSTCPAI